MRGSRGIYGPMPPDAVQERGSQDSRELVDCVVGAKPGTVVVVVGGTVVVVVVPLTLGLVVVVVGEGGGGGVAIEKWVPVMRVTGSGLVGW